MIRNYSVLVVSLHRARPVRSTTLTGQQTCRATGNGVAVRGDTGLGEEVGCRSWGDGA